MKKAAGALIALVAMGGASPAAAAGRDEHLRFPIQAALEKGQSYKAKIESDVRLYFGAQKTPPVERRMGKFTANKKTNAANKSDQEACDLAFISAAVALQERARREHGNAVIDIKSVYRGENSASPTEYVCGAGKIMAGVALEGTVVRLK